MNKNSKIYVAGNTGLVGSAIIRNLHKEGYNNLVYTPFPEYDLRNQQQVADFFATEQPEYVFLAAAKVGGIVANNTYRAQFIYENLLIQSNIIHCSFEAKVKKLLFLGSSCIYPKNCKQPMREEYLLTSELEYTNEPYAIAKIAGLKTCESYNLQYGTNFISVMPTNLYGLNDNFDLEKSHVLPALIRKSHLAKCLETNNFAAIRKDLNNRPIENINGTASDEQILKLLDKYGISKKTEVVLTLWGTGTPRREFLHSDDLAAASVFLMQNYNFSDVLRAEYQIFEPKFPLVEKEVRNTHINIGTGVDLSIKELAYLVKDIVGFKGKIAWDTSKPDGTYQKLLNVDKLHRYGWKAEIEFVRGIEDVYKDYCK